MKTPNTAFAAIIGLTIILVVAILAHSLSMSVDLIIMAIAGLGGYAIARSNGSPPQPPKSSGSP